MVVAGGVHRLRQVDNYRATGIEQHVEFGKVAVHQTGAKHFHHFTNHKGVELAGIVRVQVDIVEAWRGIALAIIDQLHQQYAFKEVIWFGHPHASIGQAEQRSHLGILPGVLLALATVLRALGHGPGIAAVAHLAAFLILGGLAEAAFIGFLVDLGDAQLFAAAHHIDRGLFTAHQRAYHFVDQTRFDQGFNTFWRLHQL